MNQNAGYINIYSGEAYKQILLNNMKNILDELHTCFDPLYDEHMITAMLYTELPENVHVAVKYERGDNNNVIAAQINVTFFTIDGAIKILARAINIFFKPNVQIQYIIKEEETQQMREEIIYKEDIKDFLSADNKMPHNYFEYANKTCELFDI